MSFYYSQEYYPKAKTVISWSECHKGCPYDGLVGGYFQMTFFGHNLLYLRLRMSRVGVSAMTPERLRAV